MNSSVPQSSLGVGAWLTKHVEVAGRSAEGRTILLVSYLSKTCLAFPRFKATDLDHTTELLQQDVFPRSLIPDRRPLITS